MFKLWYILSKFLASSRAKPSDTFITLHPGGGLNVDTRGLLRSGRMDRQLQAAREMKRAQARHT